MVPAPLPTERGDASAVDESSSTDTAGASVWLHVYDVSPALRRVNSGILKGRNLGFFHCGVEVYDREWCFQYFTNGWDEQSWTGVQGCAPKRAAGFRYRESIPMGSTTLSEEEVAAVIGSLGQEWRACEYHITRRNCLSFAATFLECLQPDREELPLWLKNVCDVSNGSAVLSALVDSYWSAVKKVHNAHTKGQQWMESRLRRRQRRKQADNEEAVAAVPKRRLSWPAALSPSTRFEARRGSVQSAPGETRC